MAEYLFHGSVLEIELFFMCKVLVEDPVWVSAEPLIDLTSLLRVVSFIAEVAARPDLTIGIDEYAPFFLPATPNVCLLFRQLVLPFLRVLASSVGDALFLSSSQIENLLLHLADSILLLLAPAYRARRVR